MPTNRRSGSNGQPSGRRPKVAGLRKREQTESTRPAEETTPAQGAEAGSTAETEPRTEAAEPQVEESASASAEEQPTGEQSVEESSAEESAAGEPSTVAEEPAAEPDAAEEPESAPEPAATPAAEESSESEASTTSAGRKSWVLWAAAAVFAVVAAVCGAMAYLTYYEGPMANGALVSAGETSEVKGQVEDGVQKLFSYDFKDTAKTENAAKDLLTGDAVKQYDELFALVKAEAPKQQLVVNTTVKSSSVTRLEGDRAQVLLFVDQHALRTGTGESNVGPAQLSVTTEKQGEQWKITNLTVR